MEMTLGGAHAQVSEITQHTRTAAEVDGIFRYGVDTEPMRRPRAMMALVRDLEAFWKGSGALSRRSAWSKSPALRRFAMRSMWP